MANIELRGVTVTYPIFLLPRQRSAFASAMHGLSFGRIGRNFDSDHVLALRNLTLKIPSGARVGIIGRNGSGKSTLLRTIAGIVTPKTGVRNVEGSIGTVLTLGTGLDPERSGNDNLKTLGRLIGFNGKRLNAMVEEAGAFTELGPYLTMPVRTYSSGMMARLSFAAATAQHCDILLIDEVIATGDMHFAHKAIGRVKEMCAASGIVVVATHVYDVLSGFCSHAIWMDAGVVRAVGPIDDVWTQYSDDAQRNGG